MWNENWKKGEDYPAWGNNDVYKKTISGGYLLDDESPREAYMRVAKTVARRLYKPEMAETFFEYIWNGWLCLASPVLSNTGTDRGLPISCFGIDVADSIQDIGQKNLEMMLLAKHGGVVPGAWQRVLPGGGQCRSVLAAQGHPTQTWQGGGGVSGPAACRNRQERIHAAAGRADRKPVQRFDERSGV